MAATPSAYASADLDRRYALESIGILKPYDNLDGMLSEVVTGAFRDWLNRREQSRFVHQDLTAADGILSKSKLPYLKLIEDRDILTQISRATRTESLVRTKILREGPRYRVMLEWLHAPKMDLLASETFSLEEPRGIPGEPADFTALKVDLQKGLERLLAKVPMIAQVTGRDGDLVTMNLGRSDKVERGDTIIFGTLEDAKKHPILNSIVDWRFVETGRGIVGDIEENLIFAKVIEEQPGRKVTRWQKVVRILPAVDPSKPANSSSTGSTRTGDPSGTVVHDLADEDPGKVPARLGFISVGPVVGTVGREYSVPADGTTAEDFRAGSTFVFGAAAEGQLWLDRHLFLDGNMTWTAPSGYSQKNAAGDETLASTSASASLMGWRIGAGYLFRSTREVLGPRGFVKLGYGSDTISMTANETEYLGSTQIAGIYVGLGGDLPLRGRYGLQINADIGLMQTMTETGFSSGDPQGVTSVKFGLQGYGWWGPKLRVGAGFIVNNQSASFDNERTLSAVGVSFGPNASFFF